MKNVIVSVKKYTPNSDPIFFIAKKKFEEMSEDLKNKKQINEYSTQEDKKGMILTISRAFDNKPFSIRISPSGEIFTRVLDDSYVSTFCAYESDDKIKTLDELLNEARIWVTETDYYELVYEVNGKVIFKKIVYSDGSSESVSKVFFGKVRKFFGAKRKVIHPLTK